jgi:hypothetical protein
MWLTKAYSTTVYNEKCRINKLTGGIGMDQLLEGLKKLKQFANRQVIINFYEDDGLQDRVGFFYDYLELDNTNLVFFKDQKIRYSLDVSGFEKFMLMGTFKHHYGLIKGDQRVELYFP